MINANARGSLLQSPTSTTGQFDRSYTQPALTDPLSLRYRSTNNHPAASTLSEFEIKNLRQNHQPSPEHCPVLPDELPTLTSCQPTLEFLLPRNTYAPDRLYTLNDWKVLKNDNFQASDRIKAASELSRSDVGRVIEGVNSSMTKKQNDSLKGIEDCEKNVNHWKGEVEKEMAKLGASIGDLEKEEVRLERVLDGCEKVLEVVLACLVVRDKRQEIERVVDVDPDLIKEAEMLRDFQRDICNKLLEISSQIGQNKQLRQTMSSAVMRMYEAARLLSKCRGMTEGSSVHRGNVQNSVPRDPICWANEGTSLVERAQQQRSASQSLIDTANELTDNHCQDFLKQWDRTNEKLSFRLEDYKGALHALEGHLARTLKELAEVDRLREELKRWMRRRGEVVCLAQARKGTLMSGGVVEGGEPFMAEEPGKALRRLTKEILSLGEASDQLVEKLREVEWVEGALVRTKRALEHDITLKKFSQHLDEEVVALRRVRVASLIRIS